MVDGARLDGRDLQSCIRFEFPRTWYCDEQGLAGKIPSMTEWEYHQPAAKVNPESPHSLNQLREPIAAGLDLHRCWLFGVVGGLAAAVLAPALTRAANHDAPAGPVLRPRVTGDWWQIARSPDLRELAAANQQPVDFALWQAADRTWQLWSCIRGTKEPGNTRLFYRWEGLNLADPNWKPMGVAMRAEARFGEKPGGLQAPFVFRDSGRFVMFYGGWDCICSAASTDGKHFERQLDAEGKATLFGEDSGNARDPMVIRIGAVWYCYYTAHPQNKGATYCRTSPDLRHWSASCIVAWGGQAEAGPFSGECPFVVELAPGRFYLFRTQHYGANAQTSVYFSRDPLDFGLNDDSGHFVCTLPVAAPEIIRYKDQWFIAALLPSLKGIQVAPLSWDKRL